MKACVRFFISSYQFHNPLPYKSSDGMVINFAMWNKDMNLRQHPDAVLIFSRSLPVWPGS